jgi:hypothetical protein
MMRLLIALAVLVILSGCKPFFDDLAGLYGVDCRQVDAANNCVHTKK